MCGAFSIASWLGAAQGVDLLAGLEEVDVRVEILDLGSLQSVVAFAQRLSASGSSKIDVLINNAGIFGVSERRETANGFETHIGVNHFGPHLLTRLLEPMLAIGGRVVFLSSLAHERPPGMPRTTWDWDNVNYEKPDSYHTVAAYCRSKLANIWDAKEFAKRLAGRGITTYAVQPGLVKTEIHRNMTKNWLFSLVVGTGYAMMGWMFLRTPLSGCLTTLRCAVDPALGGPEFSGKYWGNLQEEQPSDLASDPASPTRLWAYTESLLEAKLGQKVEEIIIPSPAGSRS